MTWPQPYEGITGVDRSDSWLLSLDENATAHRDAILGLAYHLYRACLVGNPAPSVTRVYERITNPRPGDFVFVRDGASSRDVATRTKALGYLIAYRQEWWETDEEWATTRAEYERHDSDRATDHAWYVQFGSNPEAVCRWTNCAVLVAPTDPRMFDRPAGARNPDGSVTVTRDDLLSVLADDGFILR